MAEYINRDKVLVELECGIRAGNYEKGYEKYMHINSMDDCFDTVKYFDTADVVEREKIDKAVEEIEQYLLEEEVNENHEKGILFVLEILEKNGVCKRNIGEENEQTKQS